LRRQTALHEQEVQTAALLNAVTPPHGHANYSMFSQSSRHNAEVSALENVMWDDLEYNCVEFCAGNLQEHHNGLQFLNAQLKVFDHLNSEMAVANRLGLNGDDNLLEDDILDDEELSRLQGIDETLGQFHL
jgi:hypothetical protein